MPNVSTPISPFAPESFPKMDMLDGVRIATANTGIKYTNRPDLLLMQFAQGTQVAGVFTKSKAPSAPVDWCKTLLQRGVSSAAPLALLVNAGNANAFTGSRGVQATEACASAVSEALDIAPDQVLLASTGVIGEPLDSKKIASVMGNLAGSLGRSSWQDAAQAITTTDTFIKLATRKVTLGNTEITLHGIAKGSGMIAPDMATMLAFIVTDAKIEQSVLTEILLRANQKSFNSITVDSDTSTSDTALLFATQQADMDMIADVNDARATAFESALNALMIELAQLIVKDGEGAQKFITVRVTGAESNAAARKIGLAIANSPLVKTAIAGEDANWGRVVMAVGKSGEMVDRDKLKISVGGVLIATNGERVADYDEAPVAEHMRGRDIVIEADIGLGSGAWDVFTCDLTHGYITINAEYRS